MLGEKLTIEIFRLLENAKNDIDSFKISSHSLQDKALFLKNTLNVILNKILENNEETFSSLQSQLFFLKQHYDVPESLFYDLNAIIKRIGQNTGEDLDSKKINAGFHALSHFIDLLLNRAKGEYFSDDENIEAKNSISEQSSVFDVRRLYVLEKLHEAKTLVCRDLEHPNKIWTVKMGVKEKNQPFDETFDNIWIGAHINAIYCEEENPSVLIPHFIVLEPDYLIDASAIALCYLSHAHSPYLYFINRIKEKPSSWHILLGNLANYFLDELVYSNGENKTFEEVFKSSFKQMPSEFSFCKDIEHPSDFRGFMERSRRQFNNIKRTIDTDFSNLSIDLNECILEPSFYSEKYGFQGRLDLLNNPDNGEIRIVELKSGKVPWPENDYFKIKNEHTAQVAVYAMLLESVFKISAQDIQSIIFYSASDAPQTNLRFSPYSPEDRSFILNIRNLIIAIEHRILSGEEEDIRKLLTEIFSIKSYSHPDSGRELPKFFVDEIERLRKVYIDSSEYERAYFVRFVQFITRELYSMKAGLPNENKMSSISALWATKFEDREKELELISDLAIISKANQGQGMIIEFGKGNEKDANFREGDICIVYPINKADNTEEQNILGTQVLKGTIVEIGKEIVKVYFKYKQKNESFFQENIKWVIEHDKLDQNYTSMYKSIFSFLDASPRKKELLLGLSRPRIEESSKIWPNQIIKDGDSEIDAERKRIVNKALNANDYFLLVGPPGTGKTSVYAKNIIKELYEYTDENILVIAYTNRAVDELCEAIHDALNKKDEECQEYIRIGSNYSSEDRYRSRLIQNIAQTCESRKELRDIIDNTRIFIGTLASISGRSDLMGLKRFNTVIIDEASQILEPQIIGLLPMFDKFIMIGDHKQLSTISLQEEKVAEIKNPMLQELAFANCRESIFERFFRLVQYKGWENNYDILKYHGRMHNEIANLINKEFYGGVLQHILSRQAEDLVDAESSHSIDSLSEIVRNKRLCFFHQTEKDPDNFFSKKNRAEALLAVEIAKCVWHNFKEKENKKGKVFNPQKSLGIIAPYRNQIALIKNYLKECNIHELSQIMVDTVERFQGSQRDVIIISFCFNNDFQMGNFINMNYEKTVDRKLNVALSRAKKQLFLIGNWEIISKNPLYKRILGMMKRC